MNNTSAESITDLAADWVTRIQSGEIDQDNSDELRAWLAASIEHRKVFQRMIGIHSRTGALRASAPPTAARPAVSMTRRNNAWLTAVAASIILAAALAFWFSNATTQIINTQTGERLLMSLEDGSSIHLNSGSSVGLRFTRTERSAFLSRGEIVFDVNKDDPRPFFVHVEDLTVEVTGTTFQVSHYGADTAVSVIEGAVLVRTGGDSQPTANHDVSGQRVRAGQQVSLEDGTLTLPARIDSGRVAAWRDGWLYLDSRPLQELVDRLNRQYGDKIEIIDAELARSRVSVALRIGGQADTLSQIEMLLPVTFEALSEGRQIVHASP